LNGVADFAATVATVTTNTTTDTTLYPLFSETQAPNTYISLRTHASGSFFYNGVTQKVHAQTFVGAIEATNDVVSSSAQVKTFLPGGTVSSSAQYPGWVTSSGQIDYNNIQNKLRHYQIYQQVLFPVLHKLHHYFQQIPYLVLPKSRHSYLVERYLAQHNILVG